MELNAEQKALLHILKRNRGCINRNTLKTIKGQVLKGDIDGARKGINKVIKRKEYSN
jgi:hypothetical protein